MQLSKQVYARKRIHNGCLVQTENPVTQDNCSASFFLYILLHPLSRIMSKHRDAEQLPSWQSFQSAAKENKENVQLSNICYTRIWDMFCPYLCYIRKCNMAESMSHKNMISYVCTFLHMKMCNVHFSFTSFRIWTAAYQNVPDGEGVSFTCF